MESPDVLPVAGRGAFGDRTGGEAPAARKDGLVTSLEVFRVEKDGVRCFFLQQRGPVATGRQRAFAKELAQWISACGFSQAVLLSSLDAGLRADRQLQSAPVCATCVNTPAAEAGLRDVPPAPTSGEELAGKPAAARCVAPWPLYSECGRAAAPTALLAAYAADGDNVAEAALLADAAAPTLPNGLVRARPAGSAWRMPPSWRPHIEA